MKPQAILFDFDGLVLDTEVAVYEAWLQVFREHGHDLPLPVYARCVGSGYAHFDPRSYLESLLGQPVDWGQWDAWVTADAQRRSDKLSPLPGVMDILDRSAELGMPCIVASSSPRSWVEGHLNRLNLLDRFVGTCCVDDVDAPKPAPDLFLAALAKLGINGSEAIVLEDSLNGLKAAQAAGIDCVVVPNRVTSHLLFDGARAVVSNLAEPTVKELLFPQP